MGAGAIYFQAMWYLAALVSAAIGLNMLFSRLWALSPFLFCACLFSLYRAISLSYGQATRSRRSSKKKNTL